MAGEQLEAMLIALRSLAGGDSPGELKSKLEDPFRSGSVDLRVALLELAADALEESGASRHERIEFAGIRERYLPECTAHTKEQHYKSEFAIRAAVMIRAGVDPGILDEVSWWRIDDLWIWAADALVVYIRAATECRQQPVGDVCDRLAKRRGVDLSARA
jgi:hypothetical protein